MNEFDVAVLGISPDGLATAALCAQNGLKVALMCHKGIQKDSFLNKANNLQYIWDSEIGAFSLILDELNLRNVFKLSRPEYIDSVSLNKFEFKRPNNWNQYCSDLISLFPDEKDTLRKFFNLFREIGMEWMALLKTGSILSVKKMMLYRNILYTDFLDQHFKNKFLRDILSIDIPRTSLTVPVMAGYVVTQVFDMHYMMHTYSEIISIFSDFIQLKGGAVLTDRKLTEISIQPDDEKCGFKFRTSGGDFSAKWVVSTFDENRTYTSYFKELNRQQIDLRQFNPTALTTAIFRKKDSSVQPVSLKYFSDASPEIVVSGIENQENKPYKLRAFEKGRNIFVQGEFSVKQNIETRKSLINRFIVENIQYANLSDDETEWFFPEDIEKYFGYSEGFIHRWAFRENEIPINPFARTTAIDKMLSTGCWGTAWFTAAYSISRYIHRNSK